jgi:hypothetical protein
MLLYNYRPGKNKTLIAQNLTINFDYNTYEDFTNNAKDYYSG